MAAIRRPRRHTSFQCVLQTLRILQIEAKPPPTKRFDSLDGDTRSYCGGLEPNPQCLRGMPVRGGQEVGLGVIPKERFKEEKKRKLSRRTRRNGAKEAKENGVNDVQCYRKIHDNPE